MDCFRIGVYVHVCLIEKLSMKNDHMSKAECEVL